jgi:hypothetical protein
MTIAAVGTTVAAGVKAYSEHAAANTEAAVAGANAADARQRASYAESAGQTEAGKARAEGSRVVAEQRASLAGSGLDLSTGSTPLLFKETRERSETDAQQARVNGLLEAWGFRREAQSYDIKRQLAKTKSVLGPLQAGLEWGSSMASTGAKGGFG